MMYFRSMGPQEPVLERLERRRQELGISQSPAQCDRHPAQRRTVADLRGAQG
jgi:hypothetical protein